MKSYHFTKEQKNFICQSYQEGTYSISELAKELKVSRIVIKRIAKENGYEKPLLRKNMSGIKTELSKGQKRMLSQLYESEFHDMKDICNLFGLSEDVIRRIASKQGLKMTRKISWLTKDFKKQLLKWNGNISISELAREAHTTPESIRKYLKQKNIDTSLFNQNKEVVPYNKRILSEEELEIIKSSKLASWEVAEKLGMSRSWVKYKRREIMGAFTLRKNYKESFSLLEKEVSNILLDLDIAYIPHYDVLGYNVDFYLGKKLIIEVQGNYVHKQDRVIHLDKKKKNFLEDNKYKILYIEEYELENKEKLKGNITEFWDWHIREYMK